MYGIEDSEEIGIRGIGALNSTAITEERGPSPQEQKTQESALRALEALDLPHPYDRIRPARISDLNPALPDALDLAHPSDPNLALEGLTAAARYEKRMAEQMQSMDQETRNRLDLIDQLLSLSSEITKIGDKDKVEIPAKMKEILADLKEQGIELIENPDKPLTREQIVEMKSLIGGRIDQSRTEVQQSFTRMQTLMQNLSSVNDSAKRFINEIGQLHRTISRNMRAGG